MGLPFIVNGNWRSSQTNHKESLKPTLAFFDWWANQVNLRTTGDDDHVNDADEQTAL